MTESPNPNIVDADSLTGDMQPIRRAVISIGSNAGERRYNLQGAVHSLADTPEVWVTDSIGHDASPSAADVYSFSCLAYELVTGQRLFSGETLPAVVAAHFAHDGNPAGLGPLRANPHFGPLAEWLAAGLRPSPRRRPSIVEMRAGLASVTAGFAA